MRTFIIGTGLNAALIVGLIGLSISYPSAATAIFAQEKSNEATPATNLAIDVSSQASTSESIEPVPLEVNPPKLIAVWPADKATDVEPNTELHLRFDRPIDPMEFLLTWRNGGYRTVGKIRYLQDKNEIVIPILLDACLSHVISVNDPSNPIPRSSGFTSSEGEPVASAEWRFQTRSVLIAEGSPPPKVISIEPSPKSKVARITHLRIRFDRAMNPNDYHLSALQNDSLRKTDLDDLFESADPFGVNSVRMSGAAYDPLTNEFTFQVIFPADWNGEIQLNGLRSQDGVNAPPITISYSTSSEIWDQMETQRLLNPDLVNKLRDVVEKTSKMRQGLQSISETVHWISSSGRGSRHRRPQDGEEAGYTELGGRAAHFKFQGEKQFYADVAQIMGFSRLFRIGGDGTQCWFLHAGHDDNVPTLVSCNDNEIQNKFLAYANPFAFDQTKLEREIEKKRLEYIGTDIVDGTTCHVVRSISTSISPQESKPPAIHYVSTSRFLIDSNTFRVVRLVNESDGSRDIQIFHYRSLNDEMPISEFQPPAIPDMVREPLEPLGEGYDTRFIKISDGADGRMSTRWGKSGKAGTSSSGLN